jgi:hypothetical protein
MKKSLLSLFGLMTPMLMVAQLTTTVSSTNISCFGDSNGTATVIGSIPGSGPPVVISEVDLGAPDFMELTNVSGAPVNTSGWFVITSNSYTAINTANTLQWNLPASVPAGWVDYREDVTGSNYWGNNLFYNPGSFPSFTGWVLLSDNNGNIVDFIAWNWPEATIHNTFNVTAGGFTFDITPSEWMGDGVDGNCNSALTRTGGSDNDDASDWSCLTNSKGLLNSGLSLPFSGTGLNIDYTWSTGDTTSTVTGLGPGTYTVTTTDGTTTVIDTVTIIEPPIPPFSLPFEDTVVCTGNALLVNAGAGWNSYAWSNGNTSVTTIITQPGTYSVTVTDSNNCPASDDFVVNQGETPDVNLGGDSTLCADEWTLNAGNGATFNWNTGGTAQFWTATQSGNYAVTVTSVDGCIGVDDVNLTLYPVPQPDLGEDFVLCYNLNQTRFITPGSGFDIYQWSNGSNNANLLVGNGITTSSTQTYTVTVTDDNGCTASDEVEVTYANCVGTGDEPVEAQWHVYPNPASGTVFIESDNAQLNRIAMFDITGKLIKEKYQANNASRVQFELSGVDAGTYFLKLYGKNHEQVVRLIVH